MKLLQIKETCIYIHDLAAAYDFYHATLKLELINYQPGKHLFLRAGKSVLLLFNPDDSRMKESPPAHFGEGRQHFAFEVENDDYEETKQEIVSKGISILEEVTWKSGKKSFYFEDPAGNVLEVLPETGIWD